MKQGYFNSEALADRTMLVLYELSLNIGQSLDPGENSNCFLQAFREQLKIEFASVWVQQSYVSGQQTAVDYQLIATEPLQAHTKQNISFPASVLQEISTENKTFLHIDATHALYTDLCTESSTIPEGKYILFPLPAVQGFLKVYQKNTSELLTNSLIKSLHPVLVKFAKSLALSLQHQQMLHRQVSQNQNHTSYYQKLVETKTEIIYTLNQEGLFSYLNPATLETTGYTAKELLGKPLTMLVREDYRKKIAHFYTQQIKSSQQTTTLEFPVLTKKKKEKWIEQKVELSLEQEERDSMKLTAYARDITTQKHQEEQSKLLRKWIDQFKDAFQVTDMKGNFIFVNQEAASRMGYSVQELLSMNVQDVDPTFQKAGVWESFLQRLKKKHHALIEGVNIHKDGFVFPVEINAQYMYLGGKEYVISLARDISERKRSEQLLKSFVETAPAAIAMFDKDLIYLTASKKWYEDYHIQEDTIIGKSYYEVHNDASETWKEIHQECLKGIIQKCEEDKIVTTQNKEAWMKWEVRPWYNLEHRVEGLIMYTEDITPRKKQEEELRVAKVKAEEASSAKEQFLANVSHEIRTPMHAILGMTRLLQKTGLSTRQSTYQEAIKASADNLLVIINDILDISKIEAGKLTIESVGFDLRRLVHHLCNSIKHRAEEKGIGLFYEIDRRIGPILIGDPVRLNQVLLNLVNNAIKFTNQGSVEIECKLLENKKTSNVIEFKIIDTGIGIPEDKLSTIFESFSQGDDSISRKFGGTGLGLSISKRLVEIFGGDLQVQSKKSTGTTFFFSMELPIGEEIDLKRKKETQKKDVSLQGVKILLAEDHDINQFLATTILDEWGTVVEVVENGKEAIQKLTQHPFDIILMDIQMPVMGGIEATRIIRDRLSSDIPIIALTANALKGDSDKYLDAGMNGYVSKPFEPVELFNKIAHLVQRSQPLLPPDDKQLKTQSNQMNANHQKDYSLDKLQRMVEKDQTMIKKMILMFLEKTPESLAQMEDAFKNRQMQEVGKLAHKLKSSIQLMGIDKIHDTIRMLEKYALEDPENKDILPLIQEVKKVCYDVFTQLKTEI